MLARQLQAALKNLLRAPVQYQMRPKELQGALSEGVLIHSQAQSHLPAQVKVGSRLGFLIGDTLIGLQQQDHSQKAGRDTISSIIPAV